MKKHVTVEQLRELNVGDYVWFTCKLYHGLTPNFKSQEQMDKGVAKQCSLKNLKSFLKDYNVNMDSQDIDEIWVMVKKIITGNNK